MAEHEYANGSGQVANISSDHNLLRQIFDQGRLTLDLLRQLVLLLMPKEGAAEGPSLEQLLAKLVAQQSETINLLKLVQADLNRLGESLPSNLVEALVESGLTARVPRS